MQMSEMSAIDSDGNGTITFDEFSAPTVDRLKSGFDMLDTDNNGKIDQKEWDEYLIETDTVNTQNRIWVSTVFAVK